VACSVEVISSLIDFISRREHLLLDVDVKSSIEAAPAAAEFTPFDEVYRKLEIESA
jgi:hypothetical protein